jgi:hypothetical protein
MKKLIILLINIMIFSPNLSFGKGEVNFGVIFSDKNTGFWELDDSNKVVFPNTENYGNPILEKERPVIGISKSEEIKNFHRKLNLTISNFKTNVIYQGFDKNGNEAKVLLQKIKDPEGDLYETIFAAKKNNQHNLPILFWTSKAISPTFLSSNSTKINDKETEVFKNKIRELYKIALELVRDKDRTISEISDPIIKLPNNSNIAFINFSIVLERNAGNGKYFDKRASAFFMYNIASKKIIKSRFGHPEWSSGAGDEIEIIKPIFFFQLDNKLMAFCKYEGSWEYSGYTIMDAESGKIIMKSY